jgi:hypothetical protein
VTGRDDTMEREAATNVAERYAVRRLPVNAAFPAENGVVEGLARFSPLSPDGGRSALAPVRDLEPELVLEVASIPEQVDDESVGLPTSAVRGHTRGPVGA